MKFRRLSCFFGFLFSCLVLPFPALAQFADSVTTVHMGGNVHMLEGAGDVIAASIGEDGVLLVDDGFPETVDAVRSALASLGGGEPLFIINTHWHHSGANDAFSATATIIAHEKTRERLRDGAIMYMRDMPPREPEAMPDITFTETMSMYFNGERIDLVYLPDSHTDTDIAVIFTESNVAVLGDLYVPFIPITDYASGGDLYASVEAVKFLLERLNENTKIVPGHGRPSTYQDLKEFLVVLTGMIEYVESAVAEGKTQKEVIAAGIPEKWSDWTDDLLPADFVLQNLYEGVTRPSAYK